MAPKKAFTLIELLVVIAIIAILAAIIFPVYSRVKDSAYRSSDISNLNQLRTALQLYRTDQGAYPPELLGYVTLYTSGANAGNVIPANQLVGALYPKRVSSIDTFRPAYLRDQAYTATTEAVWPTSSMIGGSDTSPLQRYGPADGPVSFGPNGLTAGGANPAQFYTVSGYDTASVKTSTGDQRELRYALFWTGYGLSLGSSQDDPRQLGYTEPPETTVVTWDSYFRDYDSNAVPTRGGKRDIVLFLGGSARVYDSLDVYNLAWQVNP